MLHIAIKVALIGYLASRDKERMASDIARLQAWNVAHPEAAKLRQQRYNKTEKAKARLRRYAEVHPDRIRAAQHSYNLSDAGKQKLKRYAEKHPDRIIAAHKRWCERNPEKMREIWRNAGKRRYASPRGRIIVNARNRIRAAVKSQGVKMSASASKLIGCDWDTLRNHLQSQFVADMSFDNYGKVWHVDHKKPIASFDLSDAEQMKQCFHYSNLQPLFGSDNLRKGSKVDYVLN